MRFDKAVNGHFEQSDGDEKLLARVGVFIDARREVSFYLDDFFFMRI